MAMPTGFGFAESGRNVGRFVVDRLVYKTYSGWCDKCEADGAFVREDVKPRKSQILGKFGGRRAG